MNDGEGERMLMRAVLLLGATVTLATACKKTDKPVQSEVAEGVATPAPEATPSTPAAISGQPNITVRPFMPTIDGQWIGNGISYGPYREGETPGGEKLPPKENILEDMKILSQRWNLIRTYGSGDMAEDILEVIRDNEIPMRVMQGAWIAGNQTKEENDEQVQGAIDLANRFPEIVVSVNVGNEILVDWSGHRIEDYEMVIGYIRQVRAAIQQPVTVNDDYNFWNKPESKQIADEVDFIGLHAYAFWNNKPFDEATAWTEKTYNDIQAMHPAHQIAYCETGWPTNRVYGDGSYEGGLIGKANEENQERFFAWYDAWIEENQIVSLYFEAFDESWKGGWD
ncbi:MAG: hypothetical protein AAFV53_39900, partial [Myxococcota bacterium]